MNTEQKLYNVDLVLENGTKLAEGTYWKSDLPKRMPKLRKTHVLLGVIINGPERVVAIIRDEKDYEDFIKIFNSSSFTFGGGYSLYSMPRNFNY